MTIADRVHYWGIAKGFMRVLLSVALISVPLAAQSFYYLPQVVDGPMAAGSLRTTLLLTNVDTTGADVSISFTRDDGSARLLSFPALGSGNQFSLTLAPGASQILQSDGTGDGSAGAAIVSSSAVLGVSTVVSAYDLNANPISESGASSSDLNSSYLIPIDTTAGLNTGVAIFNSSATGVTLTFTLFDVNGAKLESVSAALGAGGHLARLAAGDLFPDIGNLQGTVAVGSSAPVAASAFRQNAAAPSYTLLDAVPQNTFGLNFDLPQIADGPTASGGALQTTFLLYNLSANPATVTLSLVQDSAAPWTVNIPGLGSNNAFSVTLAPGGSAFLQTDGEGASTTGAARINSTQPIGVSGVVTATDANGAFLSESAMPAAVPRQKFLLPFDTTNGIETGLAVFNPASQPVALTVNQLDSGGAMVASAQSQPIAPGAHMTAYVTDLFPGVTGAQGALSITATGWAGASVAALDLRQNATPLAMAATPAAPLPITGAGLNITSTPDSKSVASAAIQPAGGTLSLTDAKGNKFTLTIPANALLNTTTITMTAVSAIAGLPPGGSFNAGVQLDPDGLALNQPALLTIEPASPPSPDAIIPLGWHGGGQDLYLNVVQPQSSKLTLVLNHFSGAAVGAGADAYLTSQLLNVGNAMELDQSLIAYWYNKARTDQLVGSNQPNPADLQHAYDIVNNQGYSDIQNLMRLALQTQDDNTLQCAANYAQGYTRFLELTPGGDAISSASKDAIQAAIMSFLQQASGILYQHFSDQCKNTHDPLIGFKLVELFRGNGGAFGNLQTLQQCSPAPTLNFQSEISSSFNGNLTMSGDGGYTVTNTGMGKMDLTLAANPILTGTIDQDSFTGMGDGYTTYMLTGSGPSTYKASSGTVTGTVTVSSGGSAPPTTVTCNETFTGGSGSTLNVIAPSQIQYQFTSKFTPTAVLGDGKTTLAQFCPVTTTTPVSVSLTLDPGMPTESFNTQCSAGGAPSLPPQTYWLAGWSFLHHTLNNQSTITGWQIPGPSSFAHKDITSTATVPFTLPPATTGTSQQVYTEKTTLDLNQPQ